MWGLLALGISGMLIPGEISTSNREYINLDPFLPQSRPECALTFIFQQKLDFKPPKTGPVTLFGKGGLQAYSRAQVANTGGLKVTSGCHFMILVGKREREVRRDLYLAEVWKLIKNPTVFIALVTNTDSTNLTAMSEKGQTGNFEFPLVSIRYEEDEAHLDEMEVRVEVKVGHYHIFTLPELLLDKYSGITEEFLWNLEKRLQDSVSLHIGPKTNTEGDVYIQTIRRAFNKTLSGRRLPIEVTVGMTTLNAFANSHPNEDEQEHFVPFGMKIYVGITHACTRFSFPQVKIYLIPFDDLTWVGVISSSFIGWIAFQWRFQSHKIQTVSLPLIICSALLKHRAWISRKLMETSTWPHFCLFYATWLLMGIVISNAYRGAFLRILCDEELFRSWPTIDDSLAQNFPIIVIPELHDHEGCWNRKQTCVKVTDFWKDFQSFENTQTLAGRILKTAKVGSGLRNLLQKLKNCDDHTQTTLIASSSHFHSQMILNSDSYQVSPILLPLVEGYSVNIPTTLASISSPILEKLLQIGKGIVEGGILKKGSHERRAQARIQFVHVKFSLKTRSSLLTIFVIHLVILALGTLFFGLECTIGQRAKKRNQGKGKTRSGACMPPPRFQLTTKLTIISMHPPRRHKLTHVF